MDGDIVYLYFEDKAVISTDSLPCKMYDLQLYIHVTVNLHMPWMMTTEIDISALV